MKLKKFKYLKSFQISQLAYDVTVRFCELYIDKFSRTHDQMVQAARSGVQNIAEGSQASATSKKTEIKLTNVARASLEELKLDYEDYLRQRGLEQLRHDHPALARFKQKQCKTLQEVQSWVKEERQISQTKQVDTHRLTRTNKDIANAATPSAPLHDSPCPSTPLRDSPCPSVPLRDSPCPSVPLSSAALVANAALSLLNLACHLLNRQIDTLANDFENEGGFTERLYKVRTANRRQCHD